MKSKILRKIAYILVCSVLLSGFFACASKCEHTYEIENVINATCTQDGYVGYRCLECGKRHQEELLATGHIKGEKATLWNAQVCTICDEILNPQLDYLSYTGSELPLNLYYKYSAKHYETEIDTQNHKKYEVRGKYVDANGMPLNELKAEIPTQEFYRHQILSPMPLNQYDGRRFETSSGFKLSFSFDILEKKVTDLYGWRNGEGYLAEKLSKNATIVHRYAIAEEYNQLYEIVDFSKSILEVSKKTDSGYNVLSSISTVEEWANVLENGKIEISDANGSWFFAEGIYRVLFRYNVAWVADRIAAVYEEGKTERPIWPYGELEEQVDCFYVTVTSESSNVLIPYEVDDEEKEFFCQIRAISNEQEPFLLTDTPQSDCRINFLEAIAFRIHAKVDMTREDFFYNQKKLKSFSFEWHLFDPNQDAYILYQTIDLMPLLTEKVTQGESIFIEMDKDPKLRGEKSKLVLRYSTENESKEEKFFEQKYYGIIDW